MGCRSESLVGGLGTKSPPDDGGILHNKNRICDAKMHTIVIFCIRFVRTHNSVSHAKIAQSTTVKQCVLATLKRDVLVVWTPRLTAPPYKCCSHLLRTLSSS